MGLLVAAFLACATLCVTNFTSVSVSAADESATHSHPICGAEHTDIGDHTGDCPAVKWTAWDGKTTIVYDDDNTAYVYLSDDVTRTQTISVNSGKTLYLCLNGHSITCAADITKAFYATVVISYDARFVLCDCKGGGTITHTDDTVGKGVRVGSSSGSPATTSFTMFGGSISGNRVTDTCDEKDGGGVLVQNATFTMYGGAITDNHLEAATSNYGGGGLCTYNDGEFIMYGGTIDKNSSSNSGGGVAVFGRGALSLYGGAINGNTANKNGGGIYTNANLTISENCSITGNTAAYGGGIYSRSSSFNLLGANVTKNTATSDGGGIYMDASSLTINMDNGDSVTGNAAMGNGGGIYVNKGSLTIDDGGSVTGNTATGNGGGIYFGGSTLTLSGGNITGNATANNGGGIYFGGSVFYIYGNVNISENKKNDNANNVYLPKGKIITISGELTCSAPIGVTTEVTPGTAYVRIALCNADYADPNKLNYENINIAIGVVLSGSIRAYLVACLHDWEMTLKTDETNHWRECSICGAKRDNAAHTEVTDEAVAATCTATGLTEGSHCSVCNKTLAAQTVIPATGHTESDWLVDVAATCEGKGSEHKICKTCNAILEIRTTEATGHTEVVDEAVAATCTDTGLTAGTHCSVCNKVIVKQEIVAKLNHTESDWIIDEKAGCVKAGSEHKECTVCKTLLRFKSTDPVGHKYDDEEDTECNVCGYKRIPPKITEGQNGKWKQGKDGALSFTSNIDPSNFIGVSVDGVIIDGTKYEKQNDGEIIVLKAEYLTTLSAGKHTLSIISANGNANAEFTIEARNSEAKISDTKMLWLLIIPILIFIVVIVYLTYIKTKRPYDK